MGLFERKTVSGILEELIRYLPLGIAWRGARSDEGGWRVGDPDPLAPAGGVKQIVCQSSLVLDSGTPHFQNTIKAGAWLVNPETGLRFREQSGAEIVVDGVPPQVNLTIETVEMEPLTGPDYGTPWRALCTHDTAGALNKGAICSDSLANMNFTNSKWLPGPTPHDGNIRGRNLRYIQGSGGFAWSFDIDDQTNVGLPFAKETGGVGNYLVFNISRPVMIAAEVGSEYNLPEDSLMTLENPEDNPEGGLRDGWGIMRVDPGGSFTGGVDPKTSVLRLLLRAIGHEIKRAHDLLRLFSEEIPGVDPITSNPVGMQKLISEWESAVGIPDTCFPGDGDLDTRRRHVLTKLASLGVQTNEDFETVARLFGFIVQCQPGLESALCVTRGGSITEADCRWTVVITFYLAETLTFTYTFLNRDPPPGPEDGLLFFDAQVPILECLFAKLIPANCQLRFLYDNTPV